MNFGQQSLSLLLTKDASEEKIALLKKNHFAMMPKFFAKFMFRLLRVTVVNPNEGKWPKKYILPTVTHTSNRDFPYGIYLRAAVGEYIGFVGKSSLFKFPLGPILRWMGGVPVIRDRRTNFVQGVANIFKERDEFRLCIAVEGTRSKVSHFKTGFYFIAKEANIPFVLCKFNLGGSPRTIEFSEPFYPTDDIRADFDKIYRYFDGALGINPELSFTYDPAVLDLLPEVRPNKQEA